MINSELKVNALVKQDELGCYGWIHEEALCVVEKLDNIDEEHGIYFFQAYNIDRDEWGGVTSDQIIILDDSIIDLPPLMSGCDVIYGSGSEVFGFKNNEENLEEEN